MVEPQRRGHTRTGQSTKVDFVWSLQRIHSPVQGRGLGFVTAAAPWLRAGRGKILRRAKAGESAGPVRLRLWMTECRASG